MTWPSVVERRALLGAGPPVHALEGEIAADEHAPLAGQRLVERGAERADGGNGGDAERDAEHEDGEPAGAGAELAQRDGEAQAAAETRRGRAGEARSAAVTRLRPGAWRPRLDDTAIGEAHDAVAALGERAVMGDEQERGAGALLQREQQVHDVGAGGLVEIAGRLVGEDEGGLRRKRAGHGHPLLLAAGELPGEMRLAMREADLGKRRARRVEGIVAVEELERQRHVLDRRHGRHEVEGLEHDADIGGTETGEIVLVERAKSAPSTVTRPSVARSSPAMTMSSVDLPEPSGRPRRSIRPLPRSGRIRAIWRRGRRGREA